MEEKLTKKSYFVDSTFSIEKYNFQTKRKRMANILKLKYLISNE